MKIENNNNGKSGESNGRISEDIYTSEFKEFNKL